MKKRKRRSHVNAKEFERLMQLNEVSLRVAPTSGMRALDEGSKRILDTQAPSVAPVTRELMRGGLLSIMALFAKGKSGKGEDITVTLDGEEQSISAEEFQAVADGVIARAMFDIGAQLGRTGNAPTFEKPLVTFKKGDGEVRKKRLAKKKGAPRRKR